MKPFDNEWIFDAFAGRPTFFTKRMFGGLAAYLHEHQASIRTEFPALAPHRVLKKWLYIETAHEDFESTMEAVARRMARNDRRFGIAPAVRRGEPSGSPGKGGPKGPPLRRRR